MGLSARELARSSDCGNAQNCVEVCPKEIPLTDSLADVMRATTKQGLLRLLRR